MEADLERVNRLEDERNKSKERMYEELAKARRDLEDVIEDWWKSNCEEI